MLRVAGHEGEIGLNVGTVSGGLFELQGFRL